MVPVVLLLCVLVSLTHSHIQPNIRGETGDLPARVIRNVMTFDSGVSPDIMLAAARNSRGDGLNLDPRGAGARFNPKRLQYNWPKHALPAKVPQSSVAEVRGEQITQAKAGCCKTDSYQR